MTNSTFPRLFQPLISSSLLRGDLCSGCPCDKLRAGRIQIRARSDGEWGSSNERELPFAAPALDFELASQGLLPAWLFFGIEEFDRVPVLCISTAPAFIVLLNACLDVGSYANVESVVLTPNNVDMPGHLYLGRQEMPFILATLTFKTPGRTPRPRRD